MPLPQETSTTHAPPVGGQFQPFSEMQVGPQPLVPSFVPSSQFSPSVLCTMLSPQNASFVHGMSSPGQVQPATVVQSALQPAVPSFLSLPRSQASAASSLALPHSEVGL